MYRRLVIDGNECDLPKGDFSFSLVYEIGDGGSVSGAYAKRSVTLPATAVNDGIFSDWGAITNETAEAQEFKPFYYEEGGITILSGLAQLQSSPFQSDRYRYRAKQHKVDLYGSNADWGLLLKNTYLRDLSYTDIPYNTASVLTGWLADYDNGDEYGFTLIKWKEWNNPGQVDIDEFTPFLFIRTLLDKIFDSIGYTIQSDFFDTDMFKKLIFVIPPLQRYPEEFSLDYINIKAENDVPVVGPVTSNPYILPTQTQTPAIGANPYDTGTGIYTVPFTGYYEISVRYSLSNIIGNASFSIAVLINGISFIALPNPIIFGNIITSDSSYSGTTQVLYLNAGDQITLAVFEGTTVSYNSYIEFSVIGEADATFGNLLAWRYMVKDWKAIDFIMGLQHMFNLRFEPDIQEKIIRIEPADAYLYRERATLTTATETLNTGFYNNTLIDSTPKIDLNKDAELYNRVDFPEVEILDYITEGETEEATETGEPLGIFAAKYTLPLNRYNPTTQERENPFFAKTIHTIDNEIAAPGYPFPVQVALIYPQNYQLDPTATEANYDISPRILYFAGVRLAGFFDGWDGKINCTFAPTFPLAWPKSFMINYVSPLDVSLSFASETINGVQVPGLLESYHLQEYTRRRVGKRLECRFFWSLLDMLNLSFRRKVLIDGGQYILEKIDGFQPLNESSTKTFFQLDQYPEQEDVDAIGSTLVRGLVNPV